MAKYNNVMKRIQDVKNNLYWPQILDNPYTNFKVLNLEN